MSQSKFQQDIYRANLISKRAQKEWSREELEFMLAHLKEMEMLAKYKTGLPHLYGFPWYKWAKNIFESTNKEIFLTAANQLSKSATATRKNIHWATETEMWPKLWPGLIGNQKPNLFWYFYPTLSAATTEVETKWIPQYLPQGDFKTDKKYGWREEYFKGEIFAIHFNSGLQIQFKSYSQKVSDLQTASVYMVTADEEMPVEYLPEIKARLNATDGYFMMVFTATLGQIHWKQTIEPTSPAEEKHKGALKVQVSLFDSQFYEDGTPSPWTKQKIQRAIDNCPTDAEVQRRVYGRFVKTDGLRYESFSMDKNMIDQHKIPKEWLIYSGVDVGSGGKSGHPAAIVFIAVSPDFKQGRVFKAWRGDGIPTDASIILDKYRDLKGDMKIEMQIYDYGSADFFSVAHKIGETFIKADKSRENGSGLMNTLFKTRMLQLFRGDPEIEKLVTELVSLPMDIDKRKAVDDLIDATRYTVMAIPWDFSDVEMFEASRSAAKRIEKPKTDTELRREWFMSGPEKVEHSIDDELDYWNNLGGPSEDEF